MRGLARWVVCITVLTLFPYVLQWHALTHQQRGLITVPPSQGEWNIRASTAAMRTINPIRDIVDQIDFTKVNPALELIKLSIGESAQGGMHNGYKDATGDSSAREVVANDLKSIGMSATKDDVVLSSGASHALMMAILALANAGDNILLPLPGFSLYSTLCGYHGVEIRCYKLLPEKSWEADLSTMDDLVDSRTRAILINNPSNPTGSVYSKDHVASLVEFAHKHRLPIIADEIYSKLVFKGETFHSVASVASSLSLTPSVPVIHVGGLAKNYVAPGWRMGWLVFHDPYVHAQEVREGVRKLATLIVGPNAVTQGALPKIMAETPPEWHAELASILEVNARTCMEEITNIPQLTPIKPAGAMYMMVKIHRELLDGVDSDVAFANQLLTEQSVLVLPGQVFGTPPEYFRIVCCGAPETLKEACARMATFCAAHAKSST